MERLAGGASEDGKFVHKVGENQSELSLLYFLHRYGDRSPRGFVARIFAIIWVLVGLVITSIFTGVVTTSLTAITLSTDVKLYNTHVSIAPVWGRAQPFEYIDRKFENLLK